MRACRLIAFGTVGLIVLASLATTAEREAGACSCAGPQQALVGPDRVDDAPLNAKIRVDTPSMTRSSGSPLPLVLRVHGGKVIATTSRIITPGGSLSTVELSPSAPLLPGTQYEVAAEDPDQVPTATVIGTFRTGGAADTTAPRLDAVGAATALKNPNPMGSACQIGGPWVTIEGVRAEDPGRPNAQLVYGLWLGDWTGAVDTKKPPTALLARGQDGTLHVGQTSLCDPRGFPFPKAPLMWLGIAAIDEAGNTSAARRVRVDLAGARQR